MQLGEKLMRIMSRFAEVVAEDLGTVPPFLRPSLERVGVPGYRVLRWERDGDAYRDPTGWPATSVATNATHDTDTTAAWYDGLSLAEREELRRLPGLGGIDPARPFDDQVRDLLLATLYAAPSTLALIPIQDALGVRDRINVPAPPMRPTGATGSRRPSTTCWPTTRRPSACARWRWTAAGSKRARAHPQHRGPPPNLAAGVLHRVRAIHIPGSEAPDEAA